MSKKGEIKNRVGEKWMTNNFGEVEIIEYFGTNNCTILFENGIIKKDTTYQNIKRGEVGYLISRLNKKFLNNQGCLMKIVEYFDSENCTIQFEDGRIYKNISYHNIKKGKVNNPYFPSVFGIGYVGVGYYSYLDNQKMSSCAIKWKSMIQRCYSKKYHKRQPTYKDCTVDEVWHNFQNFAQWLENNFNYNYMDSKWCLDKDILVKNNKTYSPETCCFVPQEINNLFMKCKSRRGSLPIGVHLSGKRYAASLNNVHIGTYDTPEEAFQAYKTSKEAYIKVVAEKWKGQITEEVYQALINYNVEITD